jgi:hypothetical protein
MFIDRRTLDTPYGRIEPLRVPKLRCGNGERDWQILQRYQWYCSSSRAGAPSERVVASWSRFSRGMLRSWAMPLSLFDPSG